MGTVFALSDIHGELNALQRALEVVSLDDPDTTLVVAGDTIDHAFQKPESYTVVMDIQQSSAAKVVVLMGNIDRLYLDYLNERSRSSGTHLPDDLERIRRWLSKLPSFYETAEQIFVHAGIDEEAGDLWRVGTNRHTLEGKYPPTKGPFLKDIIAGHVGTCSEHLANDPNFHGIFWDGESHYYLDGSSELTHNIPVLKYDERAQVYSAFVMQNSSERTLWAELPPAR
ncbi:metallophosphoesterase [uncultured Adlercreutzia sp.]|uniref:metallophosphoesterase n=1 Tax=uncultured Adlercreutzia sp. TaxID=875803 RepID=UPI0025E2D799|nr:metallophosphoesterase [uncultured Adlercreutzia sp.]